MSLLKQIESDMREAMKAGDTLRADTLKMVKSDIMYEKAKTGENLSEEKVLEVVTRAAKKRRESMEEYRKGNREDLAEKEEKENEIIQAYLPEMMSEEEVSSTIDEIIAGAGAVSKKDFGRIMGMLMKELKGKADGAIVKKLLGEKLTD